MLCGDMQGTRTGAFRHRNGGERPCDPCRDAYNANRRRAWHEQKPERDPKTIKSVIVDVLVTQDRWLSIEVLIDLVLELHPEWKPLSVRRAIWRMAESGLIESRLIQQAHTGDYELSWKGTRVSVFRVAEFRADDSVWERIRVA